MALVLEIENTNQVKNHAKLYSFVKEELGEVYYKNLTHNSYEKEMAENAAAFSEQLPFYSIKYLYIYSSYLFYKNGASLGFATVLPSLLSTLFLAFILFNFCLSKNYSLHFSGVFTLTALVFMQSLARYSTPDAMSLLCLSLGVIALLKKSHYSSIYFLISLFIRPDNIIFLSLLFGLFLLIQKVDRLKYFINLAVFFIVYFTLQSFSENAGWQVLYYHAFVEYLYFPLTSPAELNFSLYLAGLVKQLPLFLVIISTIFAGSYYIFKKTLFRVSNYKRVEIILITSSILCFMIRYLLFPTIELRFNMIFIIIYALSLLSLFESHKKSGKITS